MKKKNKNHLIPGFQFAGLACGIKNDKNKKDLAIIFSTEQNTISAGVFTQNQVCAAPVHFCRENILKQHSRLIVVNSGCANAATGKEGLKDAWKVAQTASQLWNISLDEVLVSSTGKIGERLPVTKITAGLGQAKKIANPDSLMDFANAICTTDAYTKTAFASVKLKSKKINFAVIAKGAGMIHPDMATMLCYVLTDLKSDKKILQTLLKECVDETLNCLTVDGDTSTNDTVLLLANGLSQNNLFKKDSPDYKKIKSTLTQLLEQITILIASDGEGSTKCLKIKISGARSRQDAKQAARAIGNSQLVKTAMFGNDPNWGRILCAAGYSGAQILENKCVAKIGPITVFSKGKPLNHNEKKAALYLKSHKLADISINLGLGNHTAQVFASDLSYEYVRVNAEYRT